MKKGLRTFKSIKEMPGHNIGDLIYKLSDDQSVYMWEKSPQHMLESKIVEQHTNFFEEIFHSWCRDDIIYFITLNGLILDDIFHPSQHSSLVHFGNAFKNIEAAEECLNEITKTFNKFRIK